MDHNLSVVYTLAIYNNVFVRILMIYYDLTVQYANDIL